MKKKLILDFFKSYTLSTISEPSTIPYKKFSKKNPDVSFKYFNRIFNEMKLNFLPKKLTLQNASEVISIYPTKYGNKGFIKSEIKGLLKMYKINEKTFNTILGVNTAEIINNEIINYKCDIELTIKCILRGRDKSVFEWD
jgi:hypothetical protein